MIKETQRAVLIQLSPFITEITAYIMNILLEVLLFPLQGPFQFFVSVILPLIWAVGLIVVSIYNLDADIFLEFPLKYTHIPLLQIYLFLEAATQILNLLAYLIFIITPAKYLRAHVREVTINPFNYLARTGGSYRTMFIAGVTSFAIFEVIRFLALLLGVFAIASQCYMV